MKNQDDSLMARLVKIVAKIGAELTRRNQQIEKAAANTICPLMAGPCIKEKCVAWMELEINDPQNKERKVRQWGCSHFHWARTLQLENAYHARYMGAALDRLNNESIKRSDNLLGAIGILTTIAAEQRQAIQQHERQIGFAHGFNELLDLTEKNGTEQDG